MQKYVLGVAVTSNNEIVLINKRSPEWQRGLYNFVGGKIEPDETPLNAMIREFKEETGVECNDWFYKGVLKRGDHFEMFLFYANGDEFKNVSTTTQEPVVVIPRETFYNYARNNQTISNLPWIYEFCIDPDLMTITVEYE